MITTAACFAALMVFGIFPEIHNDWGIWDLKCSHEMAVSAVKSRRFVDTPVWFHDFLLKYMKSNFLAVRTKNPHEINICWLLNHHRIPFFAAFWVVESPFFLILNHQDQRSDVRGFLGRFYASRSYEFFQDITPISLDWWLVEASKMTSTKQKDRNPLSLASNLIRMFEFHGFPIVFLLFWTPLNCWKQRWCVFLRSHPGRRFLRHSDAGDSLVDRGTVVADEDLQPEGAGRGLSGLCLVQPRLGIGLWTPEGEIGGDLGWPGAPATGRRNWVSAVAIWLYGDKMWER